MRAKVVTALRIMIPFLASGGTHCNVTPTLEGRTLQGAFGREGGPFLAPSLRRLATSSRHSTLSASPTDEALPQPLHLRHRDPELDHAAAAEHAEVDIQQ